MAALCLVACRTSEASQNTHKAKVLTKEEQQTFDELYKAAMRYQLSDRPDAAYEIYARALEINPDAPEVLFEMSVLNYGMQSMFDTTRTRLADSLLLRAIEMAPENVEYKETLASVYIMRRDYKKAVPLYEIIAHTKPFTAEKTGRLVSLYEATGNYEGALRSIAELEELEGADEEYSIDKLRNYIKLQDSTKTYSLIDELRRNHPKDTRYDAMLADIYMHYGDTAKADSFLKSINATESGNPYLQMSLARLCQMQKNTSAMKEAMQKVAVNKSAPENMRFDALQQLFADAESRADSVMLFGLVKQSLQAPTQTSQIGRYGAYIGACLDYSVDSIEVMLKSIIENEPTFEQAWSQLISLKYMQENIPEALRLSREAQVYNPDYLYFYVVEGMLLNEQKNTAATLDALRRGEKVYEKENDADEQARFLYFYADILHTTGNDKDAFRYYEIAIGKDSTNMTGINNYAYYLSLVGEQLERAEQLSRKTIEAEPNSSTFLDTYAWILYKMGRYKEAREYIDRIFKENDDKLDATIFDHAGDIYLRCGDRRMARKFWTMALKMQADPELAKSLRKKLKQKKR